MLAAVALLLPACGGDGDGMAGPGGSVVVPAAWGGVWQMHSVERDCGSATITDENTSTDTLCAGQEIDFDEGGSSLNCSGNVTDTQLDITCTTTETFEGVTYTVTVVLDFTRSGDTFAGTVTFTVREGTTVVGCSVETIDATRISPEPVPCTPSSAFRPRPRFLVADPTDPR